MARVCDPSNARAPGTLCAHRNDALLMRASNSHSSCSHVAAVHEVFESQRLHRGKWIRTRHPEAFSAEDPAHWTNRIGEPTGDADADCLTPDEWASSSQAAPEGWEWVDQRWMVDAFHNEKISSRQGWLYAPNFEVLRRNLIDGTSIGELEYSAQVKSAAESGPRTLGTPLPVRWRRWVRRRKRSDGADEALEEAQKEAGTFDIAAAAACRIQRRPSSKERAVPKREFKPGNWGQQTGRKDPSKVAALTGRRAVLLKRLKRRTLFARGGCVSSTSASWAPSTSQRAAGSRCMRSS